MNKKIEEVKNNENPLGYRPVGKLLFSMAFPAIVANVINALYNIVDQIFIGWGVGYLGNAATNISFPLTTICLAIGLMIGIGSASNFNLELGRKNYEKAKKIVGTAGSLLLIIGVIICVLIRMYLKPLMISFGATDKILGYAMEYTGITSYGIPFLLFAIGMNPLVRADGSPKYSMAAIVTGAVMNTVLDPIFIFVFNMGIAGAAWATVISQFSTSVILIFYFTKFKTVSIGIKDFSLKISVVKDIMSLGMATFIFQFSNMIVQITTNNQLKRYGGTSIYGSDIPIAVSGIVVKINIIFIAVIIGLVQGSQPIIGYNYGAENYKRVRQTTKLLFKCALIISTVLFVLFQLFPGQIVNFFGSGDELYFKFAVKYMRIFMLFMFLNGVVTVGMTFFPAIGKAKKGAVISVVRQIVLLLPLLIILPSFIGVEGIVIAVPVSDFMAFIMTVLLIRNEFDRMPV